jgi:hypothetical protein
MAAAFGKFDRLLKSKICRPDPPSEFRPVPTAWRVPYHGAEDGINIAITKRLCSRSKSGFERAMAAGRAQARFRLV